MPGSLKNKIANKIIQEIPAYAGMTNGETEMTKGETGITKGETGITKGETGITKGKQE